MTTAPLKTTLYTVLSLGHALHTTHRTPHLLHPHPGIYYTILIGVVSGL